MKWRIRNSLEDRKSALMRSKEVDAASVPVVAIVRVRPDGRPTRRRLRASRRVNYEFGPKRLLKRMWMLGCRLDLVFQ